MQDEIGDLRERIKFVDSKNIEKEIRDLLQDDGNIVDVL